MQSITVLTAAGVLVSGTRGAWVAVVVVLLILVLPQLQPRRRIAAVVMALALGVALYQLPGVPDLLAERTGTVVSTGGAGRSDIWSVAGSIYASAPVLGVGYANFPVAYTPEMVRAANVNTLVLSGRGPHNAVVGTLIELGPIGLILLVLAVGQLVVRRGWGRDAAMIQAALASLLTLALFLDIMSNRKQVWLVIGLAAGLRYLPAERRKERLARTLINYLLNPKSPTSRVGACDGRLVGCRGVPMGRAPRRRCLLSERRPRALTRRGLDIIVATPTPWTPWPLSRLRPRWRRYAAPPRSPVDNGITVIRPRYLTLPGEPSWAFPDRLIARAVFRDRQFWRHARVIHGHSAVTALAAWRLARRTGLPFVITFHGGDLNSWPDRHPDRVADLRAAAREARAIVTVSADLGGARQDDHGRRCRPPPARVRPPKPGGARAATRRGPRGTRPA